MFRRIAVFGFGLSVFLAINVSQVARAQEAGPDSGPRAWMSRTGAYMPKATLIRVKDGAVDLQKVDGTTVSVPIENLRLRRSRLCQEVGRRQDGPGYPRIQAA